MEEDSLKKILDKSTDVPMGSRLGVDRARSARIKSARLLSAKAKLRPVVKKNDSIGRFLLSDMVYIKMTNF